MIRKNIQKKNMSPVAIGFSVGVVLLGVVLRFGLAYAMRDSFDERGNRHTLLKSVVGTLNEYGEFGIGPNNPTADCEPIYPVMLSIAYKISSHANLQWLSVCALQTGLFLMCAMCVGYTTHCLFARESAALIAFTGVFLYPFYITQTISIVDTSLTCFGLSVLLLCWVKFNSFPSRTLAILLGVVLGLCLLIRFGNICLAPFLFGAMWVASPGQKKWSLPSMCILSAVLTISPWCARNYSLVGRPIVTSHGAIELWFAFNELTREHLENNISVDRMRHERFKMVPGLNEVPEKPITAIEREAAVSKRFLAAALGYLRSNPLDSISLSLLKFQKFWTWNLNPRYDSPLFDVWASIYAASYIPILLLGWLGVATLAKVNWSTLLLPPLLIIVAYTAMHSIVFGFTRLRLPLDQMLIIYAAQYSVSFWRPQDLKPPMANR